MCDILFRCVSRLTQNVLYYSVRLRKKSVLFPSKALFYTRIYSTITLHLLFYLIKTLEPKTCFKNKCDFKQRKADEMKEPHDRTRNKPKKKSFSSHSPQSTDLYVFTGDNWGNSKKRCLKQYVQ